MDSALDAPLDTAGDVLVALTKRYAFAEVAALVAAGAGSTVRTTREVAQIQQLCAFGQRLLDLDAEDFGELDAANGANTETAVANRISGDAVPSDLRLRALQCRMPQSPRERNRGALNSLRPAFQLLLEVTQARFRRRETVSVIATAHIASEYAPLLVWEQVLGHAGDPARLGAAVGGEGSVWGEFDNRRCPHTRTEKSAASRALRVSGENDAGWQSYLDRQHSHVAHALAVCAADCKRPCTVLTRLREPDIQIVRAGCRLALALTDSAIVKLRHSAPVGHGFGVPSRKEVLDAWDRSRSSLARIAPAIGEDDGFVLPGFAALVSALAGVALQPETLLADTASRINGMLAAGSPAPA